ncbi:MAG TPA: hypothetical protein GX401_01060 [Clostridiales bacterium]|nr:hypothetical protein [Clostridiales bacterium]
MNTRNMVVCQIKMAVVIYYITSTIIIKGKAFDKKIVHIKPVTIMHETQK